MYTATRGYTPVEDTGFRPRITVVVPAKNEEGVIESVVRTVFQSDYPSSKMEVIVVDDGSTDKTWERIQRVQNDSRFSERLVLLRHEKNYGKRVALASAVARARGEMIVCIDSDSFVERDAIKLLVQPLEDSSVTAVCGHGEAANRDGVSSGSCRVLFWNAGCLQEIRNPSSRQSMARRKGWLEREVS